MPPFGRGFRGILPLYRHVYAHWLEDFPTATPWQRFNRALACACSWSGFWGGEEGASKGIDWPGVLTVHRWSYWQRYCAWPWRSKPLAHDLCAACKVNHGSFSYGGVVGHPGYDLCSACFDVFRRPDAPLSALPIAARMRWRSKMPFYRLAQALGRPNFYERRA